MAAKKEKKATSAKAAPKKEKESAVKKTGKLIADVRLYDVIERPHVTEKATMASEHNKVVFKVRADADKATIKRAVEQVFGVKVTKVNTINIEGKTKRFRGMTGKRGDMRKAIVTLAKGETIDLAAGLR
jgi:large subunit ribosomal protein L23